MIASYRKFTVPPEAQDMDPPPANPANPANPPPTISNFSRISKGGHSNAHTPCIVCGAVARWNDAGLWRCGQCWPAPHPGHSLTRQALLARKDPPRGAPWRPGQYIWLYRCDAPTLCRHTPVRIAHIRMLWPGEYDLGWRTAAGELHWHNARLVAAAERPAGTPAPFERTARAGTL